MDILYLSLNQKEILSDLGLKDFKEFSQENVNKGKQKASAAVAEISQDGDTMGRLKDGGNKIAQIAKLRSKDDMDKVNTNVKLATNKRVKFSFKKGNFIDFLR